MDDVSKEDILKRLSLSEEQGVALLNAAKKSPMEALMLLQTFNLDPEKMQNLMSEFMTNPGAFFELAKSLGFSEEEINSFKEQLG